MITVNKEQLLYSLLEYGFEKVDNLLLNLTYLELENLFSDELEFFEAKYTKIYEKLIKYNVYGIYSYKLPLDEDVKIPESPLLFYIKQLDFKKIINKKVRILGKNSIETARHLYSDKELKIINKLSLSTNPKKYINKIN